MIDTTQDGSSSGYALAGYASVFNTPDLSGDRVMFGAFGRSLKTRGALGVRMLWNHDPAEPIGVWTHVSEDALGLRVQGRLTPGVPRSDSLAALVADGALDGLSIGFHAVRSDRPRGATGRRLIEVDLWEISLVAFPMQPGARLDAVPDPAAATPPPHTYGHATSLGRQHAL
ncbi:MAG: HK97 family phage prohead protease [Devosiaceae bacterium]|nr:HK97 family phage prohead protease [Devosiaceae bacterium MH13]